jgi:hypothetical protein
MAVLGCGRGIGDGCKTSFDCSQTSNDRVCDVSQPGGYCTIERCDETSCPDESVCIRFFPRLFLTRPCDPAAPAVSTGCRDDELCLDSGLCAPRASERRYCAHTCGGGGDCRGGYECRVAGTLGSMALVRSPEKRVRFCAPKEP